MAGLGNDVFGDKGGGGGGGAGVGGGAAVPAPQAPQQGGIAGKFYENIFRLIAQICKVIYRRPIFKIFKITKKFKKKTFKILLFTF